MSTPGFRGPDPFAPGPGGGVPHAGAAPSTGGQYAGGPNPVFGGQGAPTAYPGQPAPSPTGPAGQSPIPVRRSSPPVTVWLALACLVAAAGLCVAQAVLGIRAASRSDVDDAQVHYLGFEVADLSTTAIVFTVLLALVFALGYLGFGYAVWRGQSWPAPLGSVLAALSLFGLMGGPLIIALVVVGILAVVFLWLPPSREFARQGSPTAPPTAFDPWGAR